MQGMKPLDLPSVLELPELPEHLARVDTVLKQIAADANPYLSKPLGRLLTVRGKRLRPALVLAVAAAHAKPIDDKVIAACASIELIHLSSLIHDDVMDHATTRWNIPTISAQEGVDCAILAGDYLFARGCVEAASVGPEAVAVVAAAFAAICQGQATELADQHNLARTETALLQAVDNKTATLIAAACQLGGLCADLSGKHVQALADYGMAFGRSFQLIDDVLDFIASPERFGKPVGNDVREGNYTLPLILALHSTEAPSVKTCLEQSPKSLPQLLARLGTIEATIEKARTYNQLAKDSLTEPTNASTLNALRKFPSVYTDWALANLA